MTDGNHTPLDINALLSRGGERDPGELDVRNFDVGDRLYGRIADIYDGNAKASGNRFVKVTLEHFPSGEARQFFLPNKLQSVWDNPPGLDHPAYKGDWLILECTGEEYGKNDQKRYPKFSLAVLSPESWATIQEDIRQVLKDAEVINLDSFSSEPPPGVGSMAY